MFCSQSYYVYNLFIFNVLIRKEENTVWHLIRKIFLNKYSVVNMMGREEGEERELRFDVVLILYASLSNYYKANYLLQLLD